MHIILTRQTANLSAQRMATYNCRKRGKR